MEFNYEQLLQHSNETKNSVEEKINKLSSAILTWKEHPKKWSIIDVLKHLNIVYELYRPNFEKAIAKASELSTLENQSTKRSLLGRLSIYSMKPKGKRRRFKMKTFDFFEPQINTTNIDQAVTEFLKNKEIFHELMRSARLKDLQSTKMPTALGEKMKFYVAECFEFLIAHEDRHLVQIEEILQKQGVSIN